MNLTPLLRCLLLASSILGLFALGGCASATAPVKAARVTDDKLAGHWEGTWQSVHGHHGRLLCDFTRLEAQHYQAVFSAYWGALHGNFTVVFTVNREGKVLHFQGSKDLGGLYGGLYHYTVTAAGGHFVSHYTAAKDEGTFEMGRPARP